jgi:hypothetical protein
MLFKNILKKGLSTANVAKLPLVELKHLPYEIGALEPVLSGHLM